MYPPDFGSNPCTHLQVANVSPKAIEDALLRVLAARNDGVLKLLLKDGLFNTYFKPDIMARQVREKLGNGWSITYSTSFRGLLHVRDLS